MLESISVNTSMSSGKDSKLQKIAEGEMGYYIEDATHYKSIIGGLQHLVLTRLEVAYTCTN